MKCPTCKSEVTETKVVDLTYQTRCTYCWPVGGTCEGQEVQWTPSDELKDTWARQDEESAATRRIAEERSARADRSHHATSNGRRRNRLGY